jgi:hypothetical protein
VCVHASPSLQRVPLGLAGLLQTPVAGLQLPASWHWSPDPHTTGVLPVHRPLWQVSVCVQALPSLQGVPSTRAGFTQSPVAGLHTPALWHWSGGAQLTGGPGTQWPAPSQASAPLQALPSPHEVPADAAAWGHSPQALQPSTVQGLPSSQLAAVHPTNPS